MICCRTAVEDEDNRAGVSCNFDELSINLECVDLDKEKDIAAYSELAATTQVVAVAEHIPPSSDDRRSPMLATEKPNRQVGPNSLQNYQVVTVLYFKCGQLFLLVFSIATPLPRSLLTVCIIFGMCKKYEIVNALFNDIL